MHSGTNLRTPVLRHGCACPNVELHLQAAVEASVERCHAEQGPVHAGIQNHVGRWTQFRVLLHRTVLAFLRDLGAFWLRVVMYTCLCVCLGTVYFQLGSGWNEGAVRCTGAQVDRRETWQPETCNFSAVNFSVNPQKRICAG